MARKYGSQQNKAERNDDEQGFPSCFYAHNSPYTCHYCGKESYQPCINLGIEPLSHVLLAAHVLKILVIVTDVVGFIKGILRQDKADGT